MAAAARVTFTVRRVENLAGLLHDNHGLALVVAELGDGEVGHRWRGSGVELLDPVA
jgi:hypothetical protein